MAKWPEEIYEQRELENLPGIEYDASNKRTLFAEDIQNLGDEIRAIEENMPNSGGLHKYSTEPQVVGEWIDGRDVYEVVIVLPAKLGTGYNNLNVNYLDIDLIISGYGWSTDGAKGRSWALPDSSSKIRRMDVMYNGDTIQYEVDSNDRELKYNYFIMRYLKKES